MDDPWAGIRTAEQGADPWAGIRTMPAGPGESPDNPLDEEHPKMDWWTRARAMNLTANSEHAARWLQSQGWDTKDLGGYNIAIKPKGSNEPWRVLDSSKKTLSDLTDIGGDIATGIGAAVGGTMAGGAGLATGPGAVLAGAGGATLGAGAVEGIKQGVGALAGMDPTATEAGGAILREGITGGAGEGVLRGVVSAAKPVIKNVLSPALKLPARIEEAASGQAARDQALKAGRQISTDTGATQAEKNALTTQLKQGSEDIGLAKRAATNIYNRAREGPEWAARDQALADLRNAMLRADTKSEEALRKVLEGKGVDYEKALSEGAESVDKMLKPTEAEPKWTGSTWILPGEAESTTHHMVFRNAVESDVLHPSHIYASILERWPEFTNMMSRDFEIPMDKFQGLQGLSKDLRNKLFFQKFRKVGPEAFTRMTKQYQQDAAKLILTDKFGTLAAESKAALSRIIRGVNTTEADKQILAEELLKVAAKLKQGDPEVRAARKAYQVAQAAASDATAAKTLAQSEKIPKINALNEAQDTLKRQAIPKIRELQDYLDRLKIERVENVSRPKESLTTRRYPYFGRQAVETGLKTISSAGSLLDWVAGQRPEAIQRIVAELDRSAPWLAQKLREIKAIAAAIGSPGTHVAAYEIARENR